MACLSWVAATSEEALALGRPARTMGFHAIVTDHMPGEKGAPLVRQPLAAVGKQPKLFPKPVPPQDFIPRIKK